MRLEDKPIAVAMEPGAAVSLAYIHKIERPIVFGSPAFVFDVLDARIDQHDAPGPEEWDHTAVPETDVAVTMVTVSIGQSAFKMAPAFDHARKIFGSLRVKTRIEANGYAKGCWRRHDMRLRGGKGRGVLEAVLERDVVPLVDLRGSEVIDDGEGIELVETGNDVAVLDVRQPADVEYKLWAPASGSQFVTGPLHVTIRQTQTLANLAQAKAG